MGHKKKTLLLLLFETRKGKKNEKGRILLFVWYAKGEEIEGENFFFLVKKVFKVKTLQLCAFNWVKMKTSA